ncbi:MAG: hypothetical protein K9J37_05400 [Saprospiraceae bacterium]|nr:hypothetical protein [Saprospiraceae bacterium]MCF8249325.1 hypothetical protein [Saprospiraceae bacterium]MCF8279746.1 hypothetical protein [Bacteroidales bacterium]MCF8311398.1 hypothetical protein [Saprospiraceae bacterium]MCF8439944.1 hypothetical protein [Saprospiraceae bacterium]
MRRVGYEFENEGNPLDPNSRLQAEYVNIFGVPFNILPQEGDETTPPPPPLQKNEIKIVPEKAGYQIELPNIIRIENILRPVLSIDEDKVTTLEIDPYRFITNAELGAIIEGKGAAKDIANIDLKAGPETRLQSVIFKVAQRMFEQEFKKQQWQGREPFLFTQFLKIVQDFIDSGKVRLVQDLFSNDEQRRNIALMLAMSDIVGHILAQVREQNAEKIEIIIDKERPVISTADMPIWLTTKPVWYVEKCHLNGLPMDSGWEASEAFTLDKMDCVDAWIKNDHFGFVVWYFGDGSPRRYFPDFVVRLKNGAYVVVETKGKNDKTAQIKRQALQGWVKAVNSLGTWGKWHEVLSLHPGDLEGKVNLVMSIL